ncbi:winged helix-turn-helix domain-containing protein [Erwinia sp. PK3-005]|uniref:Winged helix-turn-helix domain-containing protein n=1 Tax=Mixta hanseatica TaxID=2872648 RepID=A0ABY4R9S4_9GAMM|nr:winged helix-turn-helix domain-containing protein [Mixta hanseatica]UQY43732.1 winged helix-turn-helix domain-containing protein [Mixta hanseatica]
MGINGSKKFIINGTAIFLPDQRSIASLNKEKKLILYNTASRCLLTLIEHAGQTVSHQQLYQAGWEYHGREATPNTLYQTISEIRKSLQQVGLENIISTQPRTGWIINKSIVIVEVNEKDPVELPAQPKKSSLPFWKGFTRKFFFR